MLLLGHKQRFDLIRGVIARRAHRLHHQAGLSDYFVARGVFQENFATTRRRLRGRPREQGPR